MGSRLTTTAVRKEATGPICCPYQLDHLLADGGWVAGDPGLEDEEAERDFPLDRIAHTDHSTLSNIGMGGQHLFHRAGREAVASHIDDVVGADHHVDVAIVIEVAPSAVR